MDLLGYGQNETNRVDIQNIVQFGRIEGNYHGEVDPNEDFGQKSPFPLQF